MSVCALCALHAAMAAALLRCHRAVAVPASARESWLAIGNGLAGLWTCGGDGR